MLKTCWYKVFRTTFSVARAGLGVMSLCALLLTTASTGFPQTRISTARIAASIPKSVMLEIVRAEDERRWDNVLRGLLSHKNSLVRRRAALAAGRIGDEHSVADLSNLLRNDRDDEVRAMAAFALGEIESDSGAKTLLDVVQNGSPVRQRALEALGKIAAALPKERESRQQELATAILEQLRLEHGRRPTNQVTVLLGITAVLRSKPANAGSTLAGFLTHADPRIRADAANALARLRLNDGNLSLRKLLPTERDPNVRANAARVLGATEEKSAFDSLLDRALKDTDSRVRVSAIRALASLKDGRATGPLLERGAAVIAAATVANKLRQSSAPTAYPVEVNELLEIATTLGRLRQESKDERTVTWLRQLRPITGSGAPEVEIAIARIHPAYYMDQLGTGRPAETAAQEALLLNWRAASSIAQGLGEIAAVADSNSDNKRLRAQAERILRAMLDYRNSDLIVNTLVRVHSEYAIPDVLRAFAAFKPKDLSKALGKHLTEPDVIVRSTAAELLGELPPDEAITQALVQALPIALRDKDLNDAALSILDALAKQKNTAANEAVKSALDSSDHLIRRRAVALLKANGAGDFSSRIGIVQAQNPAANYERAISRIGKRINAVVTTSRGSFTIELLPDDAPLNVDNFIQLAKRGYFKGITIHRVVPNFVIQDGDPRGDGNGGPGYQIRCEINQVPYERGMVGMALSGKDTGGSQWFVTHAPQPHLDGGYTVFGRVVAGIEVVDLIVRGDVVQSIEVKEPAVSAQMNPR
jgi:cyclophilin family peptidyl-prolyl cis-trans isomerase/HEAT repeat protein